MDRTLITLLCSDLCNLISYDINEIYSKMNRTCSTSSEYKKLGEHAFKLTILRDHLVNDLFYDNYKDVYGSI